MHKDCAAKNGKKFRVLIVEQQHPISPMGRSVQVFSSDGKILLYAHEPGPNEPDDADSLVAHGIEMAEDLSIRD